MSAKPISYSPSRGLSYDPEDPVYWDKEALKEETERIFEICHGCRLCFKYCEAFPKLFSFVDNELDGDLRKINNKQIQQVADACFQCKLCEVQCPYTPRDGHEYQVDFPKLIHRLQAQKFNEKGPSLRDKVLADADKAGAMARKSFGLVNKLNCNSLHRAALENTLGIHRDKLLPKFSNMSFEQWALKNKKVRPDRKNEVVLFQTCYVQNNEPEIGQDTLAVLEQNNVKSTCLKGFKCCGMPFWEHGDLESLRAHAEHNLNLLAPQVSQGAQVVVVNPTCSMMMRNEYLKLLPNRLRSLAQMVADVVRDPGEFLWELVKGGRFNSDFKSSPGGSVGYHSPCHLRAQRVGFKSRDLIKKIPGVQLKMVMECSGHDGTYSMKKENYLSSIKVGEKSFRELKQTESDVWCTECPLAAIQFEQHAGQKPLHTMSVLARAYKADGFPVKIEKEESDESSEAG